MNANKNITARGGIALLAVLMIVMVITILALGFLSRSDVELACGRNMEVRAQMDYLAESGLEHARGLVLNPQDVTAEYWTGELLQQLVAGSGDYYDLTVTRDDTDPTHRCNYTIDCNSYRERLDGSGEIERIGRSNLRATLRLDPCIAYWAGSNTTVRPQMTINGDVYCGGNLTNNGDINGDVFAIGTIGGTNPQGQKKPAAEAGVIWPNLMAGDFNLGYYGSSYYVGSTQYWVQEIAGPNIPTLVNPTANNRRGVCYSVGDVNMPGNVTVNGTLVVDGTLRISGVNNVITAEPNFPALLVTGQVVMEDDSALVVWGLAQIDQQITADPNTTSASIQVIGGLFIANGGVMSDNVLVNINAAPAIASIETWSATGVPRRWGPAGGAFFTSIERR